LVKLVMWLRTRRSGVRISQGAPLLESKGFNQSELHPDRLSTTRRSSMSSSHKYFFILQNQHVTDANLTSFYGPQKLSRKRHTLRGPTPTRSNVLRDHPLCYQESCLPELLCVLRIRFGRPSTVRRAGLGVLGTPDRLLSRVTGKPHLIGLPKDRRHNWPS